MNSLALNSIPGYVAALAKARGEQARRRENALLNLTHDLCGVTVRTMTVLDYISLDRFNSPFLYKSEPTLEELAFFLWVLSPSYDAWRTGKGWRVLVPWFQRVASWRHGRMVRRKFGKQLPESSEPAVVACFEYIKAVFFDAPAAVKSGHESCITYLTYWFHVMQSEYHVPADEVWAMGMPELFQRLNAIRMRDNPNAPQFNRMEDELNAWILRGLREGAFSMDELAAGNVPFPNFSFTSN